MDEKELNEVVNEEEKDIIPTESTEVKSEEVAQEAPEVQEETVPEDEGVTLDVRISKDTFVEFYSMGQGWGSFLKTTGIYCLIMVLIIYLFRDKENGTIGQMLAQMGIYCGIVIVVNTIMTLLTNKVFVPKQYKKMDLENLAIKARFTNLGVYQTIEGNTIKIPWNTIIKCIETDISFIFYSNNRSGFIFTKENIDPSDLAYIRELLTTNVMDYKFVNSKIKKEGK